MGTCIDYAFRFGGNEAKTEEALEYIGEIQSRTAEYSGHGVCDFSADPHEAGAFKQWHCYCKSGDPIPDSLREKLIELTIGGDFKFWFYWDCTDGCNDSCVEEHHDGVCIAEFQWTPGILGLDASIAAAALDVRSDADAVLQLIDVLLSEGECDWDEDDLSTLENARAAGVELARAFQHWPNLLLDRTLRAKFDDVTRTLHSVREGGVEYFLPDHRTTTELAELQALRATLEAELLKQVTHTPSAANPQHIAGKRL